jgi:hypothetical protein
LTLPACGGDTRVMQIAFIRRNVWWWRGAVKEWVLVA